MTLDDDSSKGTEWRRLRVLFLPAWYPSEVSPLSGVFVKEHAKAASLYNDVVVVYAYHSPNYKVKGFYQASEAVEEGLRTVRIRYRSPSVLRVSSAASFSVSREAVPLPMVIKVT